MSFRVKLKVKAWKLPALVEAAREYQKVIWDARRLPDYPKGNECVQVDTPDSRIWLWG